MLVYFLGIAIDRAVSQTGKTILICRAIVVLRLT